MNFANPATICEAWYAVARSSEIRPGRIRSGMLGGNRIALWRESAGEVRALEARCAHLGADLTQGDLVSGRLRCPFHHWEYDADGQVAAAPVSPSCAASVRERAVFRYPVAERFGLVWVWNGPSPRCALPRFEEWNESELRATALRSRLIPCHPHLVASNGLDFQHWQPLHGLDAEATELEESAGEQRVSAQMSFPLGSAGLAERLLRGIAGERVRARYTNWSGNVATVEGRLGSFPLLVLFAMTPDGSGHSVSRTQVLRPKSGRRGRLGASRLSFAVTLIAIGRLLIGDRQILDRIRFRPALVSDDVGLAAVLRLVNRLPTFDPSTAGTSVRHDHGTSARDTGARAPATATTEEIR